MAHHGHGETMTHGGSVAHSEKAACTDCDKSCGVCPHCNGCRTAQMIVPEGLPPMRTLARLSRTEFSAAQRPGAGPAYEPPPPRA